MNGANDSAAAEAVQEIKLETEAGNKSGLMSGSIFARLARGAFLLMLATILVSWAMTIGNSSPVETPKAPTGRMYS